MIVYDSIDLRFSILFSGKRAQVCSFFAFVELCSMNSCHWQGMNEVHEIRLYRDEDCSEKLVQPVSCISDFNVVPSRRIFMGSSSFIGEDKSSTPKP